MRMHKKIGVALILSGLASVVSANSDQAFRGSVSLGYLNATLHEYVYASQADINTGFYPMLSFLKWDANSTAKLSAILSYDPTFFLTVNVRAWATLPGAISGSMLDHDYETSPSPDIEYTTNDVRFDYGYFGSFDLVGWLYKKNRIGAGLLLGYQYTNMALMARGGTSTDDHLRTIRYRQTYYLPYAGFVATFKHGRWDERMELRYSSLSSGRDRDTHYDLTNAKTVTFEQRIRNKAYMGVTAELGYQWQPNCRAFFAASWNKYEQQKASGNTVITDSVTGVSAGGKASFDQTNYGVQLGVSYSF